MDGSCQELQEAELDRLAKESLDEAASALYWRQETERRLRGLEQGMPFLRTNIVRDMGAVLTVFL